MKRCLRFPRTPTEFAPPYLSVSESRFRRLPSRFLLMRLCYYFQCLDLCYLPPELKPFLPRVFELRALPLLRHYFPSLAYLPRLLKCAIRNRSRYVPSSVSSYCLRQATLPRPPHLPKRIPN